MTWAMRFSTEIFSPSEAATPAKEDTAVVFAFIIYSYKVEPFRKFTLSLLSNQLIINILFEY